MDENGKREDLYAMRSITLLLIVALCLAPLRTNGAQRVEEAPQEDDAAARKWAMEMYDEVANRIFGSPTSEEPLPLTDLWRATARVRHAYDEPEIQLSLTKQADGTSTAVLTKLSAPLLSQLQRIYRERPTSRSLSEVAEVVQVERVVVASADWRPLQTIVASLETLRSAIAVQNAMVVDPRQYQLWIDGGGQQVYFNLLGPSSGQSTHPIVQWIETASRQVERAPRPAHRKE